MQEASLMSIFESWARTPVSMISLAAWLKCGYLSVHRSLLMPSLTFARSREERSRMRCHLRTRCFLGITPNLLMTSLSRGEDLGGPGSDPG